MARRNDHTPAELKAMVLQTGGELIREKGFEGLRARAIAERIGYTVGTLYHAFNNLDDIVDQINLETAKGLFAYCTNKPLPTDPGEALKTLGNRYATYVKENANLWRAVISYPFSSGHQRIEDYDRAIEQFFVLICSVTDPLYQAESQEKRIGDARILWSCLYGVCALDTEGRLGKGASVGKTVNGVVEMFLNARRFEAG